MTDIWTVTDWKRERCVFLWKFTIEVEFYYFLGFCFRVFTNWSSDRKWIDFYVDNHWLCYVNYENRLILDDFGPWYMNVYWNLFDLFFQLLFMRMHSFCWEKCLCLVFLLIILQMCSLCKIQPLASCCFFFLMFYIDWFQQLNFVGKLMHYLIIQV